MTSNLVKIHVIFALYISLSHEVLFLKSDFFSQTEFFVSLLVDIFRAAEKSNPQTYTCRQELMDFLPSPELHQSVLSSSYDKIGLNLKFERALLSENILGPSAVTRYNRNSIIYYHHPS